MSRALVLGATGHIGAAMVRELLTQGFAVSALSRRAARPPNLNALDVDFLHGDGRDPATLDRAVPGHDLIVDAAAPYLEPPAGGSHHGASLRDEAHRHGTAVAEAAGAHDAALLYVSSFTTQLRPRIDLQGGVQAAIGRRLNAYFAAKQAMERSVLEAADQGLRAVVINPTLCLGPWDVKARVACFVPRLVKGDLPGAMHHMLNVVDVRDVATIAVEALRRGRLGQPLLVTGHNVMSDLLFRRICELGAGAAAPGLAPAMGSVLSAAWLERLLASSPGAAPGLSLAVSLIHHHEWLAPTSEQRALLPRLRSLSATLADSIDWYRSIGYC